MTIILVRHGAYSPSSIDPEEGLSPEGKLEVETLLKKFKEKKISFSKVLVSPKKRAQQTAEILSEGKEIETTPLLKGGERPENILSLITSEEKNSLLLVGHNPYMEYLSTLLGQSVHFKTAGCAIFENKKLIHQL